MRITEILGRLVHQGRQEAFGLLGQEGRTPTPVLVAEGRRVRFADEGRRPIVDALPGHAEHDGDVGGGPPPVEFQHGQGPPVRAGVGCGLELLTETTALPVLEFQPAHLGLLLTRGERRANGVSKNFCGPA
jgi:hypothetical protein